MASVIHDHIPDRYGGAFSEAFAQQLARAARALDKVTGLGEAARRALITQLLKRWLGCSVTAFVANGRAPRTELELQTFLVKYPVCARLFAESEQMWQRDCHALITAAAREQPGQPLVDIRHDAGFLGSRVSAHLLSFGNGVRVVYRPFAVPAAAWFMDVCAELNYELEYPLHVRSIRVEDAVTWDEVVEPAPCKPRAHARYFQRAGQLVRLFEAVRAKDMHFRNVRMVGEHPVILDLEGVLAHRGEVTPTSAGFLPVTIEGISGERVQLGGLHPGGPVTLPVKQPLLSGTKLVEDYPTREITATIPAPLADNIDPLIAGYRDMDAALGRANLAPLVERVTFKSNVFGRSGIAYRALLYTSMNPELLVDEQLRDTFIAAEAEPYERPWLRSLRAVRYISAAPLPDFTPHGARLDERCAAVRAAITTG